MPRSAVARVLVVDDDVELAGMLGEYLEADPLDLCFVHDGGEACEALEIQAFDLMVLDIMLPTLDGYELLRRARRRPDRLPILMISARGADEDRITGLEAGADDYLAKPFNPRELRARINALLRRETRGPCAAADAPGTTAPLSVGGLTLNPDSRTASTGLKDVRLTNVEAGVLEILMRSAGRPVRRAQLTQWVLGRSLQPLDRSLDTHVSNLRRKLELDGSRASLPSLRSLRNVGYTLSPPQRPEAPE